MATGSAFKGVAARRVAAQRFCGIVLLGGVLLGGLVLGAGPAGAADARAGLAVESAEFVVSVGDGEGSERRFVSNLVPYLPNQACFGWRIRLAAPPGVLLVREILRLPEAPAFWSGEDDEFSTHMFSADRTTATTVEYKAPQDGWIDNQWCIVEGDPVGQHSIDVFIEDQLIRRFDFEVKRPGQ